MIKFPSIEQFRTVIRHVQTQTRYVGKNENGDVIYDASKPLPTLTFIGTVKLHGTNAGISYDFTTDKITYQSRERELSLTSDNAGFMLAMKKHEDTFIRLFKEEKDFDYQSAVNVTIFGEWCGAGIQKGVAISQLPKMFVLFATKWTYSDGTTQWENMCHISELYDIDNIYDIMHFPNYRIDIDFNFPEISQNKMIQITEAVEAECPVGKDFGVSGIGEGVVWKCLHQTDTAEEWWKNEWWKDSGTWFKVKGEKHSVSKVKTLAAVDVEAVENMRQFVKSAVTEARLEQGLDNLVREQLLPFEMKSMGDFIRWVYNDVLKEEMDIIVASQIDTKKLGSAIANEARPWFIKKFNETT